MVIKSIAFMLILWTSVPMPQIVSHAAQATTRQEQMYIRYNLLQNKHTPKKGQNEPIRHTSKSTVASYYLCTAYTLHEPGVTGITKTGKKVRRGMIAVDPREIPLGSKVYIEGFNRIFVAEDVGGKIKGKHVDIYLEASRGEVRRFGRQRRKLIILRRGREGR